MSGTVLPLMVSLSNHRLARLLQAPAIPVVKPAVVDAAEPAVLQPAVAEIGSTMRAVEPQQAGAPILTSEQNQLLVHHLER